MSTFKQTMLSGRILAGTFQKTASNDVVEVLALSGLDFVCLDAEHAPFGRQQLDACLAVARARGFPALVRTPDAQPAALLQALDAGATGIVVPHVASAEQAQAVAKAARFGHGGRGFAGSTRWAGFATRPMADVLAQSRDETVVIVQIEEPEAVEAADAIAATEGVDGLFVGPADLSVCFGTDDPTSAPVREAMQRVGEACKRHGKAFMTFAPDTTSATELQELGVTLFFVGSDHGFMMRSAGDAAASLHALES
jgi:2-keto-3-deoxy-L-rhamnonate aldolase RhmA